MSYTYPYNFYTPMTAATPSVSPNQNNRNMINWVQGAEGAKAVQLMPNTAAVLMDSENEGIFYIKSCDNIGLSSLRTFMYEEITENSESKDYITRQEFNKIINELKEKMK